METYGFLDYVGLIILMVAAMWIGESFVQHIHKRYGALAATLVALVIISICIKLVM